MATLMVLTASYRPDFDAFVDLHASVVKHASPEVVHRVVVPDRDVALFRGIASDRLEVHAVSTYLPRSFVSTYPLARSLQSQTWIRRGIRSIEAVNVRRPWPFIRGWILQQIVKMAAIAAADTDVVLTVDSDVTMIRSFGPDDFVADGVVRFYRLPGGVGPELSRYAKWHSLAAELLAIPEDRVDFTTDYVASFLSWDPRTVRAMAERIGRTTGDDWRSAIARHLYFSECILYGVYLDGIAAERDRSFTSSDSLCRAHWDPVPLDRAGADQFIKSIEPGDLAIQIQSTSRTPKHIRTYIIEAAEAVWSPPAGEIEFR